MSTSQVLDRTFYIYRNHFVLLAGIGALVPAALLVLQLSFIPLGFPPTENTAAPPEALVVVLLGYFACSAFIYVIGNALAGGATVYGVSKLHLGQSVTIGQAYKQVLSRFWAILGTILLISLIVFGSVFVGEIIALLMLVFLVGSTSIFSGNAGMAGVGVIMAGLWALSIFAAGLFLAVFFYCKFSLAVPACLLERLPVGAALSRSWNLTRNSFWRIFLIYLLTWILSFVLALALGLPGQIYIGMVHNKTVMLGVVLHELGGFIAGVIANPISTIAIALIYYDQRVRKEAFDLQLMMEAMGQPQPQPAIAIPAPPPMIG
jgi:hypothetical protein